VVDVDQQCLRSCLLPVVNLADGANPSGGHADSVKLDEQFLGGAFAENIFDHLVYFLLVRVSVQSQPGSTSTAQATSGPITTTSALYFRICL
jgi:hypothetical protein